MIQLARSTHVVWVHRIHRKVAANTTWTPFVAQPNGRTTHHCWDHFTETEYAFEDKHDLPIFSNSNLIHTSFPIVPPHFSRVLFALVSGGFAHGRVHQPYLSLWLWKSLSDDKETESNFSKSKTFETSFKEFIFLATVVRLIFQKYLGLSYSSSDLLTHYR